jgi:hypothetical protein
MRLLLVVYRGWGAKQVCAWLFSNNNPAAWVHRHPLLLPRRKSSMGRSSALSVVCICFAVGVCAGARPISHYRKPSTQNYIVIRTIPANVEQLSFLEQMERNATEMEINFWTSPVRLGSSVDFMLPSSRLSLTQRNLLARGIPSNIIIEDVEK